MCLYLLELLGCNVLNYFLRLVLGLWCPGKITWAVFLFPSPFWPEAEVWLLIFSSTMLIFHIFLCIIRLFYLFSLSVFIIVPLKSLSDISNIWVILGLAYVGCLFPRKWVTFSWLFIYWVILHSILDIVHVILWNLWILLICPEEYWCFYFSR